MTALHVTQSVDDMCGNSAPTPRLDLHLNRAIRQIHVLRLKARRVRPRRAARLHGAAEAIELSVRDLGETLGGGDDEAIRAAAILVRCTNLAARVFARRFDRGAA